MMGALIRAAVRGRLPVLDRIALTLEKRALRQLEARSRAARLGGASWRSPEKLWPDFGDD